MNRIWVTKKFLKLLISGISTGEKATIEYLLNEWKKEKIEEKIDELRQQLT